LHAQSGEKSALSPARAGVLIFLPASAENARFRVSVRMRKKLKKVLTLRR
jgi:hypothetical protein